MACHTCNIKFNFFHKEMGCPQCGLSFCGKCLKQKCVIPSKGSSEYNVCKICYNKLLSGQSMDPPKVAPPDKFLKRLEELDNSQKPSITIYKNDSALVNLRTGLSPADQKLFERLEKLKENRNKGPPPSEIELRKRLAKLKGENLVETTTKDFLLPTDSRSDQEKADDLLEQFAKERDIELQHDPQEEIEARLATLREKGVRPNEGAYLSNLHDSDDSEDEIGKITKKIMDEVALERSFEHPLLSNKSSNASAKSDKSSEQWCSLCDKDPKFRCFSHVAYAGNRSNDFEPSSNRYLEACSPDGIEVMDEVALEDRLPKKTVSEEDEGEEPLPWCVLCNEDARFKCMDCGGDLYCSRCNDEVHKSWNRDHRVVPFRKR